MTHDLLSTVKGNGIVGMHRDPHGIRKMESYDERTCWCLERYYVTCFGFSLVVDGLPPRYGGIHLRYLYATDEYE
jgi:hypothetical protein